MAFFVTAAVIGAGASLIGGVMSSNAVSKATDAQVASAQDATALQKAMYEKNLELNAPFREAGLTAQNQLLNYLGLSSDKTAPGYNLANTPFTYNDLTADPGYQFRLNEGLKSLDAQAAARGGLISGNALKAAQDYGQSAASQEYTNAYNRYQQNRNNLLNPLQSLTGTAQTTSQQLGTAGQTMANNAGNTMLAAGNAAASGYIGSANAWNNALSGVNNAVNGYATGMARYGNYGTYDPYSATSLSYAASGYPLPPTR